MKIELIEKTEKLTGRKIYSIRADGNYVSDTIAFEITEAKKLYEKCVDMASKYPKDVEEVIATCLIAEKA